MKIIVTGATGFLGKKVAERLKREGHQPIAVGRNHTAGQQLINAGVPFIPTDLSNLSQTLRVFSDCGNVDAVIHCAALSSPWGKYADFYDANVKGTDHLIKACRLCTIQRFIHISTPSLYFNYESRLLIKESDALPSTMVNSYAATKKIAEEIVLGSNVPSVILRPRGIFGPGDTALFPRLLRSLSRLPLIEGGNAWMDITYVDNVVDAILLGLKAASRADNVITLRTILRCDSSISFICYVKKWNFLSRQKMFLFGQPI